MNEETAPWQTTNTATCEETLEEFLKNDGESLPVAWGDLAKLLTKSQSSPNFAKELQDEGKIQFTLHTPEEAQAVLNNLPDETPLSPDSKCLLKMVATCEMSTPLVLEGNLYAPQPSHPSGFFDITSFAISGNDSAAKFFRQFFSLLDGGADRSDDWSILFWRPSGGWLFGERK